MTSKTILVGTVVSLAVLIGCGDDDTPDLDAGPDASDDASVADSGNESGSGGRGGRGGNGGSGGAAGSAGAGAGGSGGSGGAAGGGVSMHTVGGSVTGLAGSGLKLKNNDGDELTVSGATFEFATPIASGEDYAVTVSAQPSNPTQACTVTNGTGEVGSEDVDDVVVTCVTGKYSIKGTIATYTGSGLVLKNNGGDAITILSAATTFEFPTKLDSGANYAVTVGTQPMTQTCAVSMGSGQLGSSDVTSVGVECRDKPVLQLEPRFGSAIASWISTGATSYTLRRTTDANCDLTMMSCPGFLETPNATTPSTVSGLTNGTPYYFQLIADYGAVKSPSNRTATRPNAPRYDGDVRAVATADSGTTYVGGTFTRLSVHTGAAVPVHKTTGLPSEMPNFPIVDGDVYAVASDRSGGYYIGGAFTAIGNPIAAGIGSPAVARDGLAHIRADGTVDPTWDPGVDGGFVRTIAVHENGTVYVAGDFTGIGYNNSGPPPTTPTARAGLAAISPTNGSVVVGWDPHPTGAPVNEPPVSALAFLGEDVLVGGAFTGIAGVVGAPGRFLVLVDGTTGALETWTPNPSAAVNAITTNGNTIYVGGDFTTIGVPVESRSRLAAFEGAAAVPTSWNPDPDGAVNQISFASNTVYIVGLFGNLGSTARARLAAIDPAGTGTVKEWNPTIAGGNVVNLAASADTVYLSGSFTSVGGEQRNGTAAVTGAGSGAVTAWNPNPDGIVDGFALVGESVVMVGQHRGLGGLARQHLVAYGSSNLNDVTNWNPGTDGDVFALATSETAVYVGGDFGMLGGEPRNNVGAVDASGTLPWDPNADDAVLALAVDATPASTVYMGGEFGNVSTPPQVHNFIAAVSATGNGAPTGWNLNASAIVRAIAVAGTTVYVGGDFTTFGGSTRNHLAAASTAGALDGTWDPNVTGTTVNALAVNTNPAGPLFDNTVVAGGSFNAIGGPPTPSARTNLAAIGIGGTGVVTAFAPNPDLAVDALVFDNGALYVGGHYVNFIVVPPPNLTYLHMALFNDQGALQTVKYDYDGPVFALAARASNIYVGGDFTNLNGTYVSGVSLLGP